MPIQFKVNVGHAKFHTKQTLDIPGQSPGVRSGIFRRQSSSKSFRSSIRRATEKANFHLSSNFGSIVKQQVIPDLKPEEKEDYNIERMRLTKQREAIRKERDLKQKKEIQKRNEERAKLLKLRGDKLAK